MTSQQICQYFTFNIGKSYTVVDVQGNEKAGEIRNSLNAYYILLYSTTWKAGGVRGLILSKIINKSHCMFTSYLMIFPTFLENHFLGAEILLLKPQLISCFVCILCYSQHFLE